ncbi:MAG: AAA family ATPase [Candidatus Hydrogenedentota bacterium]|nr:MAG: AAA family ATPase [Candidatus Hydrogenedentota bacterium]
MKYYNLVRTQYIESGNVLSKNIQVNDHLKIDEVSNVLGVERARLRFLETLCREFLSPPLLEIPRTYGSGDIQVLSAANRLLTQGLPPSSLRAQLAQMLAEPSGWNADSDAPVENEPATARLIAITSGKGGVGKSNIALNLAVELVRSGLRTAVMDGDLGVANVHLLAGLNGGRTLRHVISGECGIEDVVTCAPEGPDVVPGSSGIFELANLSAHRRQMLLAELRKIESNYDAILIDTAAGVAGIVLDFVVSSHFVLVVTTAETTAITDAYALIKLAFERNPCCRIGIVVNRVRNAREATSTLGRIANCTSRFLGRPVLDLGYIWEDSRVRRAVNECAPFCVRYPGSRASLSVRKLARTLREKGMGLPLPCAEKVGFGAFVERCAPLAVAARQ